MGVRWEYVIGRYYDPELPVPGSSTHGCRIRNDRKNVINGSSKLPGVKRTLTSRRNFRRRSFEPQ